MKSLYELTEEYQAFEAMLDACEDETQIDAILDEMGGIETDLAIKGENIAKLMRNVLAEDAGLTLEIERLTKRRALRRKFAERLRDMMLAMMHVMKISSLQTSIGKWGVQKNPPGCEVLDASKIPAQFHIPQPDKIDSKAIIAEWKKTGKQTEGAKVEQKDGIRFR